MKKISQKFWEIYIVISCLLVCSLFFLAAYGFELETLIWFGTLVILNLYLSIYTGLRFVSFKTKTMKITDEKTSKLKPNEIFVFGSNLAGRHGAGAARFAMEHFGAKYGVGEGFTGQCWALPTKDENIQVRDLVSINKSIHKLYEAVIENPDKFFIITAVGCGLAGLKEKDIAPFFKNFLDFENISLPQSFIDVLNKS